MIFMSLPKQLNVSMIKTILYFLGEAYHNASNFNQLATKRSNERRIVCLNCRNNELCCHNYNEFTCENGSHQF